MLRQVATGDCLVALGDENGLFVLAPKHVLVKISPQRRIPTASLRKTAFEYRSDEGPNVQRYHIYDKNRDTTVPLLKLYFSPSAFGVDSEETK